MRTHPPARLAVCVYVDVRVLYVSGQGACGNVRYEDVRVCV